MVSREAVLAKASSWVGMLEDPDGSNNIWFSQDWGIVGQSWCFAFVQSCFYYAGAPLPHQSMYCPYGVQWARDNGQSIEPDYGGTPLPGDIVFFTWGNGYGRWTPGTGDHVGIVEGWDGGDTLYTIEGNIGSPQGVYRKVRSISGTVICFWRPTVFDPDSIGTAEVPTPAPPTEEDVTPDQAAQLANAEGRTLYIQQLCQTIYGWAQEAKNLAGAANAQAEAANTRLDQMRPVVDAAANNSGAAVGRLDGVRANVDQMLAAVRNLPAGGGEGAPVDVEAVIRSASTEQLASVLDRQQILALLLAAFGEQPKPPVVAPADPA